MTDIHSVEDEALFAVFLTNAIRSALLREKRFCNELTEVGVTLSARWISPADAIERLYEIGALDAVIYEVESSMTAEART